MFLYSKVKRTGHVSFCDLSLMEPMFFKISKMIPNTPEAKERLSHIIDLITLFMSTIVEKEFDKQILETQIESFKLANPEESFMWLDCLLNLMSMVDISQTLTHPIR